MAWKIGLACGLTATRSCGRSTAEIERRHDGGERGRRRLVAADLQPVDALAQVVGVVDRPAREPQHLALELAEDGEVMIGDDCAASSRDSMAAEL